MDYDFDDSVKAPDAAITMTDKASRRSKRSPPSSYVSTSAPYQVSPSKMMINSMLPPSKIQYPSAPMQIESFGLLDSSSAFPPNQFIISSTSLPPSKTDEKSAINVKEEILENILAVLLDLSQKEKPVKDEALKQDLKNPSVMANPMSNLPVVGQHLNDLLLQDSLVNFRGKMMGKLHPRLARQSSPGGGSWDSSAASKWMGGGSSWPSGQDGSSGQQVSSKTRQTSAPMPPSPPPPMPAQTSSSGGPPASFWEKFSSMFGSAGQAPPASGSGSQSSSQSGNSQIPGDSPSSALPLQPTQTTPPNWGYSPPLTGSDTTTPGCSPVTSPQSNQRKRGLGDYSAMHGGVSLSNIPYTESNMPFKASTDNGLLASTVGENSNIPSMSFSINPQPPSSNFLEPSKKMSAKVEQEFDTGYFLPKRPLTSSKYLVNYPADVEIHAPLEPQYIYVDSPPTLPMKKDRIFYVIDATKNSGGYVLVTEDPLQSVSSDTNSVQPMNLFRISREEKTIENEAEPVLLYAINKNGKTGKEIKKVLLDPENGMVITQTNDESSISEISSSRRKKRSTENEISNSKIDETYKDKEKDGRKGDEKLSDDPNGHSHGKNDQVKSSAKLLCIKSLKNLY